MNGHPDERRADFLIIAQSTGGLRGIGHAVECSIAATGSVDEPGVDQIAQDTSDEKRIVATKAEEHVGAGNGLLRFDMRQNRFPKGVWIALGAA